jgi:hypothetical protein
MLTALQRKAPGRETIVIGLAISGLPNSQANLRIESLRTFPLCFEGLVSRD